MILVTGGTGFIGQALIRQLAEAGFPVRTLIRPSRRSPNLPKGVPMEVAVASLNDERGLRAAMVGVDTVYHLASGEWQGTQASLLDIDIRGTQAVAKAAKEAGVDRFFYVSHLGADRASAFPVLKAKAIAEEHVRRSGVDFTILRSAIVFGMNDGFTSGLAYLLQTLPFFFLTPGDGKILLQPLWVEDLVTAMVWALEDAGTRNQVYEVAGPEYLTFNQIVMEMMDALRNHNKLVHVKPPYLRAVTVLFEHIFPGVPVSAYWLDYLASNHTCSLSAMPQVFNLMPSRFSSRLQYLKNRKWRISPLKYLSRRRETA
jgi:NADH dehydrogenase